VWWYDWAQLKQINKLFSENKDFADGRGDNRLPQPFYNRAGGLTISG